MMGRRKKWKITSIGLTVFTLSAAVCWAFPLYWRW